MEDTAYNSVSSLATPGPSMAGGVGESRVPRIRGILAITENQKILRDHPTKAEHLLWQMLRARQLDGYKFRRQHGIDAYIVDFFCHAASLVIELDGGVHDDPEVKKQDAERQRFLEENGYRVLRFKNEEVTNDIFKCLEKIRRHLSEHPSSHGGVGGGRISGRE